MHNLDEIEKWEEEMREQKEAPNQIWIKNIYWKLEQMSCILVLRNRHWFQQNIEEMQRIWNIILEERKTGYEHRGPNKRVKNESVNLQEDMPSKCLIRLKKE